MKTLLLAALAAAAPGQDLVDIRRESPSIRLDIRYATKENFTGQAVYPVAACLLQREPARALARVQRALKKKGLGLKAYDCYRPLSVQRRFWELVPDERYVADPKKGSRHNRGYAVDLTLVDVSGKELRMPSAYDDFSERAHRGKAQDARAAQNSRLLELEMGRQGFVGLPTEWWHFDYPGWEKAPVLDVPFPKTR